MSDCPPLKGRQQAAVEAFCQPKSGLVTLGSVPGAGKSTTSTKAVAVDIYRRYADGEAAPVQGALVVSFSRDDAASIKPAVTAWLETLYARNQVPDGVDETDVQNLIRRVRQAEWIGTVDGIFRTVLRQCATAIGFDGMPTVGNEALLTRLRADAYATLTTSAVKDAVARLEEDYPSQLGDEPATMLEAAREYCRVHRLSATEFEQRAAAAIDETYGGSKPTEFGDIVETVERYRGTDAATEVEALDANRRDNLLEADQELYQAWQRAVDDFGTVLERYIEVYDELAFERGVIGHLDCAYWVDQYFSEQDYAGSARHRLRNRLQARFQRVVIDEAQDINSLQHDTLAHLVTPDTRVLLVGDIDQCIYQWRHAHPSLFATAIDDGQYFGIDWAPHTDETTRRNYRSRPDIVRAINGIAEATLSNPIRGGLAGDDQSFPGIEATREQTDNPTLHVAACEPAGAPGTATWVDHEHGSSEATTAANYLSGGLTDGTFLDDDGDPLTITVLFRSRRHMDAYADRLTERGLTVANASTFLFDAMTVTVIIAVVRWLRDPWDAERTEWLVTDSALAGRDDNADTSWAQNGTGGLEAVGSTFADHDWDIEAVAETIQSDETAVDDASGGAIAEVIDGLATLAAQRRRLSVATGATVVRDISDVLALESDPLELDPATGDHQRVANIDAFVALLTEWESDDRYRLAELPDLLEPLQAAPKHGPTQPIPDRDAVDVVFDTVFGAKGDQSDVVLIANPSFDCGPTVHATDQVVTTTAGVAVAPPAPAADDLELPGFDGGLYEPAPTPPWDGSPHGAGDVDVGLRWTAEHWQPADRTASATVAGPPVRCAAATVTRSEAWRLLYVAASRAREHLVVPLPRTDSSLSGRDHWAQALFEVFELADAPRRGTHLVNLPDADGECQPVTISINAIELTDRVDTTGDTPPAPPRGAVDVISPIDDATSAYVPRFLSPSTARPLLTDLDGSLLAHLKGKSIHTDTPPVAQTVPFDVDVVGTETVGDVIHEIVIALVEAGVPEAGLASPNARVNAVVESVLDEWTNDVAAPHTVRSGLRQFINQQVLPQLANSPLWTRVRVAQRVFTDEPAETLLRVTGGEVEIHGEIDLLLELPDSTWFVEEIKTALAPFTQQAVERYKLQAGLYATALARQQPSASGINASITVVGVRSEQYTVTEPLKMGAWCQEQFTRRDETTDGGE
ncbi:UvrD-helicase domain-containing protein [Haloarcula laminariae]|uniref:UvrD-helicase domain-containing protein n=1 Tax=Haloarcula laminariae TaxID=2961577 RepID=UPI002406C849|nr:UvrD-helicase domain-containing protein [Halomicroarcula sp. FL173]